MELSEFFPMWDQLSAGQQRRIRESVFRRRVAAGELIHDGSMDCTGLLLVESGQLRAFILSEEGREISIYRLFERDVCLFSASCMLRSIQFAVSIEAERDSSVLVIPAEIFRRLMEESAPLANFANELMASRFSDVMWLIEQILWKSVDKRLAAFLLEEAALSGDGTLRLTHEQIARHLGTAREVVTRMLRYFSGEGMVSLSRGSLRLLDEKRLAALAEA